LILDWNKKILLVVAGLALSLSAIGQQVIYLQNPSFEGLPHAGRSLGGLNQIHQVNPFSAIPKWTDCGFKMETPPDLHGADSDFFDVVRQPQDGVSFLGMVVRYNDTWERVSQKLTEPLKAGKCYSFSIYLSRDLNYKSATQESRDMPQSFSKPCVLRVYGGNGYCSTKELLGETVGVENTEWRRYDFVLKPKQDWEYFELQSFYKTPTLFPYNGNLLLDNASPIREIPCPDEPILPAEPQEPEEDLAVNRDPRDSAKEEIPSTPSAPAPSNKNQKKKEEVAQAEPPKKEKILKDLDAKKIQKGQVIQIEKLFFEADQSAITVKSFDVLDEVYDFLVENPKVTVEIGGHTNSKPKHAYCDRLSSERAQSVADYLVDKGISKERIQAKGYGKRKPITKGSSAEAHRRNQRVEIKILSLDGTI
jgi:outer membrane protein OmpA-like peptidoglycan-associated protein